MTQDSLASFEDAPIREGSHLMAFLHILKKAHAEMAGEVSASLVATRFSAITTKRHAKEYIDEMMPMLLLEREHRRQRRRSVGRL